MNATVNTLPPRLGWVKLIAFCLISLFLCSLGPFGVFSSVPFTMVILVYGRAKVLSVALPLAFLLGLGIAYQYPLHSIFLLYGLGLLLAMIITEIIYRKLDPVIGIVASGAFLIFLFVLLGAIYLISTGQSLQELVNHHVLEFIGTINLNDEKLLGLQGRG